MNEYYCTCCRYATPQLSHFKSHVKSKKHTDNDENNNTGKKLINYEDLKKKYLDVKSVTLFIYQNKN